MDGIENEQVAFDVETGTDRVLQVSSKLQSFDKRRCLPTNGDVSVHEVHNYDANIYFVEATIHLWSQGGQRGSADEPGMIENNPAVVRNEVHLR